jgi:7-keto-8-aminopelargonate synthetase-like enzyme
MATKNSYLPIADFRNPSGSNFVERIKPYHDWQQKRREEGTWVFDKTLHTAPRPDNVSADGCGRKTSGPNLCSQDYLSLSAHPAVIEAAIKAARDFGVHSAGSTALLGNTIGSRALESALGEFLKLSRVLLFPTGWAAGYGVIKGLVHNDDWIVMDALSHACLQEGARAATKNVFSVPHLNNEAVEAKLRRIREKDTTNAILVVTEALFSMDSDVPNLRGLQEICRQYNATLMVDLAHDLGAIGPNGGGFLEMQNLVGSVDLVMGSFSKTFASNGGFVASNNGEIIEYLKMYSCPQTFSNALSPIQVAAVSQALTIIGSDEGKMRRSKLRSNSDFIRSKIQETGFKVIGETSAIVPVLLGDDEPAGRLWKQLSNSGTASNLVEFPGVAVNAARLRLQLQADHEEHDLLSFVERLVAARDAIENYETKQAA